jgi:dipeptidyl aminopeptidase/acylaminoacyl peptidase
MGGNASGAYRMNLKNGKLARVASTALPGGRFVTGSDLRVSVVYGVNDERKVVVYYLPPRQQLGGGSWTLKVASGADAVGDFYPVAWTGKGEQFYAMDGRDAPTSGVVVWDAEANTQHLLYRHPDVDLYPAALDPAGRPWLFAGTARRPVYWYPDPEHPLARMHRTLAQGLPQDYVNVVSQTDDLSLAVVRIDSGRRPPTFLIVDVRTAKPLQVMQTYPALKAQDMAPVDPIEFAARDGLRIRGYLTTPLAADGKPD